MKIGDINNTLNFGKVYGVYGSMKQITNLYDEIVSRKQSLGNLLFVPANDVYVSSKDEDDLTAAAQTGDNVVFIITGDEYQKINNRKRGWKTKEDIKKQVQEIIDLNSITDKQIQGIIKSTKA